jgi:hypothetical protein
MPDDEREPLPVIEGDRALSRVSGAELLSWISPWLIGAVLALAFVLGLVMASEASDDASAALGFATAAVALLGLVWDLNAALDGMRISLFVESEAALQVLLVLLGALAIGGLILAARGPSFAVASSGYALFIAALAFAFLNLKHYFDRRDRGTDL